MGRKQANEQEVTFIQAKRARDIFSNKTHGVYTDGYRDTDRK
jgi:hypothetical protein